MIELIEGQALGQLISLQARGGRWDYCLTSPPYYRLLDYGHTDQHGLEPTLKEYLENVSSVLAAVYMGMTQGGVCWLNVGLTYSGYSMIRDRATKNSAAKARRKPEPGYRSGEEIPVPWLLLQEAKEIGFYHKETLIWDKGQRGAQPEGNPAKSWEPIFVLVKDPSARPTCAAYQSPPLSVLRVPPTSERHACPMPLDLADALLRTGTRRNALLIDPYCGTGTSLLAAERRGWDSIGIDLDTAHARAKTKAIQPKLF